MLNLSQHTKEPKTAQIQTNTMLRNEEFEDNFTITNLDKAIEKAIFTGETTIHDVEVLRETNFSKSILKKLYKYFNENGFDFRSFIFLLDNYFRNLFLSECTFLSIAVIQVAFGKKTQLSRVTMKEEDKPEGEDLMIIQGDPKKIDEMFELFKLLVTDKKEENAVDRTSDELVDKFFSDYERIKLYLNANRLKKRNQFIFRNTEMPASGLFVREVDKLSIVYKMKVKRILPEGPQAGVLLIYSNKLIEFVPIINNVKQSSLVFSLSDVKVTLDYRFLYRDIGIQVFFYGKKRAKLFVFANSGDKNEVRKFIIENSPYYEHDFTDKKKHTDLWVVGLMSNFDYIMYLNNLASRSFSDLSQYPVFPQLYKNYRSDYFDLENENNYRDLMKPIGAQNLEKFKAINANYYEKLKTVPENETAFYYSHYSTPEIVADYLFLEHPWLARKYGRSPVTDIASMWDVIESQELDFKELIPEYKINKVLPFRVNFPLRPKPF